MKKHFLTALALLFSTTVVFAQESEKTRITEIQLITSGYLESNPTGTIEDFRKLFPESQVLPENLDGFSTNDAYYYNYNPGYAMSALLGIQFKDKNGSGLKPNPFLRLGVTYVLSQSLATSAYKSTSTPYDTLTSSDGTKYPLDSVNYTNYYMNYGAQQIRLDGSLIYRTNPSARWSIYSGIGLMAGISLNAKTQITYYEYDYFEVDASSPVGFYEPYNPFDDDEYQSESTINDMNFSFATYLPVGLDFRISNNNEFWKRIHLFVETRPFINFIVIPELRTLVSPGFQSGFGIKVNWN